MHSKYNLFSGTSFFYFSAIIVLSGGVISTPAMAKKKKTEDVVEPCPVDTTIRTADPNLLKRFKALAGCEDQLLVAPATELDYVEPDGRVIIAQRSDGQNIYADGSDSGEYQMQYADMKPRAEDDDGESDEDEQNEELISTRKKDKLLSNKKNGNDKGPKIETYSYDYNMKSLSGTGTVVRIIPEEMPLPPAPLPAAPAYAPGIAQAPAAAAGSGILAMRPQSYRTRFDDIIMRTANTHRIDPLFLHAVIQQESGYRQAVRSHAGAQGLMQIMPGTGRQLGVHPSNLNDPAINVDAGARLLRQLYFKYNGNFDLILAAYNAGEGAVAKYGNRIPPYRETQNYVKMVMQRYNKLLAEQNGVAPSQ
jgi:soluble lytic murein transglycosylase-like protein